MTHWYCPRCGSTSEGPPSSGSYGWHPEYRVALCRDCVGAVFGPIEYDTVYGISITRHRPAVAAKQEAPDESAVMGTVPGKERG
jgi:hypothetical protein